VQKEVGLQLSDFFFLLLCLMVLIAVAGLQIPLFAVGKIRTLFLGKSAYPQYNDSNKWKTKGRIEHPEWRKYCE